MGRFRYIILLTLFLLIDLIIYPVINMLSSIFSLPVQTIIGIVFWGVTVFSLSWLAVTLSSGHIESPNSTRRTIFSTIFLVYISKLISALFILFNDVVFIITSLAGKLFSFHIAYSSLPFKILPVIGLILACVMAISLLYGMLFNKYNYKFHRITIKLPNLPEAFDGLKIVQLSDVHSGSFTRTEPITEAINDINGENPDLIFFTGDLVNTHAKEFDPYLEIFKNLKAKYGIYSITGNHDYGDYAKWESHEHKQKNFEDLMGHHANMNWKLLMDETVYLENHEGKIAIIGIQNWSGRKNFSRYGDMQKAHSASKDADVKLLLSHDPSHWEIEVLKDYKDVDITFSGHTHGMQFGFEFGRFRWSPVQWIYKHWAGLYKHGHQYLYVNRGFGFIGYPGRVGILPEITVMTLHKGPAKK